MEQLARTMLMRYPAVRAHEQTADVVQEATLSLLVALRQLKFESTREFYGLATEHLRRRLIDLARRYANPDRTPAALAEAADVASDDRDLGGGRRLHEAVERLAPDCREVFSLRLLPRLDGGRRGEADAGVAADGGAAVVAGGAGAARAAGRGRHAGRPDGRRSELNATTFASFNEEEEFVHATAAAEQPARALGGCRGERGRR